MIRRQYLFLNIWLALTNVARCISTETKTPKIAIIGTGIGGASASHFLTKLFNNNLHIDAFETNTVGGRLATIKLGNSEYEAGGAVIHPRNKYMNDFLKFLNLETRPPSSEDGAYGIWNGQEFVFEESAYEMVTIAKLVARYGFDPFYLHRYVKTILDDFSKIYDIQDRNIAFENTTALIAAMNENFVDMMHVSMEKHLLDLGYDKKLIDELVKATLVVNYGQGTQVQSFVGSVSVAGAGSGLWSVKNGNKEVPINLILKNDKVSLIKSTVNKIRRVNNDNSIMYEIHYKSQENKSESKAVYDIVIIATPLTKDQENQITFEDFENQKNFEFSGEYHTTIATFVRGELNKTYFDLKDDLLGILSCDPDRTVINSVGRVPPVSGDEENTKTWKIFSRKLLDETYLNNIFLHIDEIKQKVWKAYPHYSFEKRLDKFKLDDSLYHVNAIEWAASAMEMSAIGGRNVAILAFNDYIKNHPLKSDIHHEKKVRGKLEL